MSFNSTLSVLFCIYVYILMLGFCRWHFVIHGGVDGYSRIPVFCKCSTNNRATTVLESFLEAVRQFGLPSRVRSDKGMENVEISRFMLEHRGPG